jgi:O-antigen/teichoic acid export membrane protein
MRRIISVLLVTVILLVAYSPTAAQSEPVKVYYAGGKGGLLTAVTLTDDITIVDNPANADVLVLNGEIPDTQALAREVSNGAGLVLVLGPRILQEQVSTLLGTEVTLTQYDDPVSLVENMDSNDPLTRSVIWNSAPQVRERTTISGVNLDTLVVSYGEGKGILNHTMVGQGEVFTLSLWFDEKNSQFQDWAYFNYLVYSLVLRAAGRTPQSFGDYPASPVPHAGQRNILLAILAAMILTAFVAYYLVRRYSKAHPEALDRLVLDPVNFKAREETTDWEQIGYHRPLGGFMLALMLGLVLFIPLIIFQNLILPVYILPSAQALGIWGRVVQLFNVLWLLLDMGTSAAFIKFFSQYRVHDPRKAIQYGQVFVWWQVLSGAIQVALVTALAGTVLPKTVYALYAWSVIIHTAIQLPGFYQVMRNALTALQRFDFAQVLDLGLALIFPILAQPIFVTIMVFWGKSHPAYGLAMGGLLGLGIAAYACEAGTFLLGLWLFRRLGYNARVFFMAHFDWQVIKESFRYGVFEMLGSVAWTIGQAMEVLVTQTRLVNYAEIWGNWGLAQNFIFSYQVISALFNNTVPSISEAISHTRVKLSQYYAVMNYKYGGMFSAFIGAVLLAVADRFILGASGPDFARGALYVIPLSIWGAIQYPSWVGDAVQLGSNRPYLKTILVASEQTIRIVLALVLLKRFQINALIIAYFIGLLTKDIVAYFINDRTCFKQRFFFWQSLFAPLLAGGVHYLFLRQVTGLIWKGDQMTSVLIFFLGILVSYPIYAFLYGVFGGWDGDTLDEFEHSTYLTSFMYPFARLFYLATALGAHISPLHNRFPITIRAEALLEAESLTEERVKLVS